MPQDNWRKVFTSERFRALIRFARLVAATVLRKVARFVTLRWHLMALSLVPWRNRRLHTNACGDFTLLSRDSWFSLRGYPEFFATGHIDSYLVIMAASAGLRQVILPGSSRLYHEDHERSVDYSDLKSSSRPLVAYEEWLAAANSMLSQMKPLAFNKENWGLGNHDLREHAIGA